LTCRQRSADRCVAANDFFTADNRTLLRLLRTLGSEGVLRIGGNTSERTLWRTQDLSKRENFVITPSAIDVEAFDPRR
jgi:hypothetical protein